MKNPMAILRTESDGVEYYVFVGEKQAIVKKKRNDGKNARLGVYDAVDKKWDNSGIGLVPQDVREETEKFYIFI